MRPFRLNRLVRQCYARPLIFIPFHLHSPSDFDPEYNSYIVIDSAPKTEPLAIKLRDRRDVKVAGGTIKTSDSGGNQTSPPIVEDNQRLLGANGTGQRKDFSKTNDTVKPTVVSDPLNVNIAKQPPKGLTLESAVPANSTNDGNDSIIDAIDVPDGSISQAIDDHSKNLTLKTDYYQYYESATLVDKNKSDEFWSNMKNYTVSQLLSTSHRRAIVSVSTSIQMPRCSFGVRASIADGSSVVRLPVLRQCCAQCDCGHWRLPLHGRIRPFVAGSNTIHRSTHGQFRFEHFEFVGSEVS